MEAVSVASEAYIGRQLAILKLQSLDQAPKEIRRSIRREARRIALADVFGVDHKKDRDGQPIEQGLGSAGNMTAQCVEAYIKEQTERRKGGPEPGYEENLAGMRKALVASDARRAAERAAREDALDED